MTEEFKFSLGEIVVLDPTQCGVGPSARVVGRVEYEDGSRGYFVSVVDFSQGVRTVRHLVIETEICSAVDDRAPARLPAAGKFVSPVPPPEGLDRELLTILAEECCEVGQRVSKALRFGIAEVQPGQSLTNAERIDYELGDLLAVVERLAEAGVLSNNRIKAAKLEKRDKLLRYLQSEGQP